MSVRELWNKPMVEYVTQYSIRLPITRRLKTLKYKFYKRPIRKKDTHYFCTNQGNGGREKIQIPIRANHGVRYLKQLT